MLWEIWGRRKSNFAFHAAALLVSLFCVWWLQHGPSDIAHGVLLLVLVGCFLGAYLDLLTCFGYIETDARKVQVGFPGRLLLKPVSTLRLVLTPMLFGGAAVVSVLLLWNKLVVQPLCPAGAIGPLWLGGVILSFFWWMQALAWSIPLIAGRSLMVVMMAVIHLLAGLWPLMPVNILSGWQWPMLAVSLVSAVLAAWAGLRLVRQGRWEGPSAISLFWRHWHPARAGARRKKFGSAFRAQFWLEWRRQGWLLPGLAGAMAFLMLPVIFVIQKDMAEAGEGDKFRTITVGLMLIFPIVFASSMGANMARFDSLQSANALPIYIAVRPMTNGGFVIAKLAMALASSVLTWLIMLATAGFWLAILNPGALIPHGPMASLYGFVAVVIGCLPALLLLILFTWKSLIGGIGAGLTGRRWVIVLFTFWKLISVLGLVALVTAAKLNGNFKELLLHWLSPLLIAGLVGKIALATAAFVWGLRRNAITAGGIGWIAGGWSVCGLFVTGYTGLFCLLIHQSDLWLCLALAGFMILPLADLAIAPLALAWNRHR
jgi:hypothetical protein